ncbi:MAG: hypothetical protein KF869_02300 [Phycisphaeraceae bacterium]|nr:hypothetical protein [Phycisphaeraceae bacterium]
MKFRSVVRAALFAAGVSVVLAPATDSIAALPPYQLVGSYALPTGAQGDFNPVAIDVLPDGRLIGVASDGRVLVQDAVNAGSYTLAGSVGPIFDGPFGNFGASFVAVSPGGSRLAIGDNGAANRVHFVDLAALSPMSTTATTFAAAPNFDGAWADDSTLYISGFGSGPGVWRVDSNALGASQVVDMGAGGSGGVAVRAGRVFIGDGFNTSDGGAPTGNVRAFDLAALAAAGAPVDFLTGTLVADALSASPVRFDALGNLLAGGGDFFAGSNDFGYAAVIDADAIAAALLGGGPAPDAAELRLSPAGGSVYYSVAFNHFTQEVLVFADGTAYRYAVPAPGAGAAIAVGSVFAAARRRRRE